MGLHFLTFYDGFSPKYKIAARQLMTWAHEYSLFDTICASTYAMLKNEPEFQPHLPFVHSNSRGFGYWIWKPFAVRKALRSLPDGDTLVYMDACTRLNIEGRDRFQEYLRWVRDSPYGVLVLGSPHKVKCWCKMDLVVALNATRFLENEMPMAGILFLRKNPMTLHLLDTWCSLVSTHRFIDDSPSTIPNHPKFIEHRHDQSVFALLSMIHPAFEGSRQIPDTEYHFPDKRPEDLVHPIWIQSNHY